MKCPFHAETDFIHLQVHKKCDNTRSKHGKEVYLVFLLCLTKKFRSLSFPRTVLNKTTKFSWNILLPRLHLLHTIIIFVNCSHAFAVEMSGMMELESKFAVLVCIFTLVWLSTVSRDDLKSVTFCRAISSVFKCSRFHCQLHISCVWSAQIGFPYPRYLNNFWALDKLSFSELGMASRLQWAQNG